MFRKVLFFLGFLLIALNISVTDGVAEEITVLELNQPAIRKIPIAIPVFKAAGGMPGEEQLAVEGAQVITKALEFTGFFKQIDPAAYLANPRNPAIVASEINFANWTAIGAEYLITGAVADKGGNLRIELRLFDTFKRTEVVSATWRPFAPRLYRKALLSFCSKVLEALTGKKGMFQSRIVFVSNGTGNKEIYTADFDGKDVQQFTATSETSFSPAWSSDGKWIAYTAFPQGRMVLYVKSRDGKTGFIYRNSKLVNDPNWLPVGFELAVTLKLDGDQEIYLLSGSGKFIKQLTKSRDIDVSPTFSPDGRKMAFVSKRAGSPQIYIKNLSTNAVQRLTFEGKYNQQPSWSPDGEQIVYTGMDDTGINIHIVAADGTNHRQLTIAAADNESPSWSPDGSLIAFQSTREGPSRIYVMTAFGTDQRRLVDLPGEQSQPSWSANIE